MSTGGLAVVLSRIPLRFPGLHTLGVVVYMLNLVLFTANCIGIVVRFSRFPWTLKNSFLHPTESLFVSTILLSVATIIIGAADYGSDKTGQWLNVLLRVLFWGYCAVALLETVALHIVMYDFRLIWNMGN